MGERKRQVDVQAQANPVGARLTCTAQPDTHEVLIFSRYNSYRDTVLLGAANSPLFSPLITIGSQDTRLRTTPVAVGG